MKKQEKNPTISIVANVKKKYPDIKGYTYAEKVNILLQKLWKAKP